MEKRIAVISIMIHNKDSVNAINDLLSLNSQYILSRYGLPLVEKNMSIITLIIEASTDKINSLTGKLGRLEGVYAKAFLAKQ
ncbi:MAG: hypothetical protein LBM25_01825 [Bacteroidales bacterium]|jgi:putative iron-only hydrogenase system regulator|nr:hypothetical protein [Bacteroidales bacterium]